MTSQPVPPMQFAFDISQLGLCFYLDESVLLGGFHSLDAVGVSLQADRIGDRGILYVDPMDLRYAHIYRTYSPVEHDCALRDFTVDIHGDMEWEEDYDLGSCINFPTMGTFMTTVSVTAEACDPVPFNRCTWGVMTSVLNSAGGTLRGNFTQCIREYIHPAYNPGDVCVQYSKIIDDIAATNKLYLVRQLYLFLYDWLYYECYDAPVYDYDPPTSISVNILVKELPFYI